MRIFPKGWLLCLVLALLAGAARAELGGDAGSVAVDRTRLKAKASRTLTTPNYTIDEGQTPAGTTIKEFISPAGKVFAVTWKGPYMPDLQQLFGPYFATYRDAAKSKRSGRGRLHVALPELVVHSGGHMRAFFGSAYVPQLVPEGVAIDEILSE